MPSVTRYPTGVTNVTSTQTLGRFVAPDPSKAHTFFDDFDYYNTANWTVTETQAGATQALTDEDGGVLLLTNTAADDDLNAMQKVGESFLMEAGKEAWFKARFRVSDATQSDLIIGLYVADTTPIASLPADGIFFVKDDGDAQLDVYCRKDTSTGSTSATNIGTVVSNTYMTVGWYYDGIDKVFYFVNDVLIGSLSATSSFLPDTELTVGFAVQNGEAVAKTMSIDYVFASKER